MGCGAKKPSKQRQKKRPHKYSDSKLRTLKTTTAKSPKTMTTKRTLKAMTAKRSINNDNKKTPKTTTAPPIQKQRQQKEP